MREFLVIAVVAVSLAGSSTSRADESACVAAAVAGQTQRQVGALLRARASFTTCAKEGCPVEVSSDCTRWRDEVEAAIPSVVVGAHDADGQDVLDAILTVDGVVVPDEQRSRAIDLNPGLHRLRFERPKGALATPREPIEQTIVLHEGEKRRSVVVTWGAAGSASGLAPAHKSHVPVASIALGGVGAAALATFVVFGSLGLSKYSDLSDSCKPRCSYADADSAHLRFQIADVALGVSVLALAAAAYFYFTDGSRNASASARRPSPGYTLHF